ncbi:MAG: hypothetical protein ACI3YE_06235 [Candidatus Avispirillum sp.]
MNKNTNGNDPTKTLLEEMYKNVKMGCENIVGVIPKVEDKFMLSELTARLEQFSSYSEQISAMMHERGWTPKEPGMGEKLASKAGIAVNTMIDSTSSHIAEMFIKGSEMGIQKLEEARRSAEGCDRKAVGLCERIIDGERRGNRKMEEFL